MHLYDAFVISAGLISNGWHKLARAAGAGHPLVEEREF